MFDEKNKAICLLNNKKTYNTNIYRMFIIISKYYKHIGLSKERTFDLLIDWLKKQNCRLEFDKVIKGLENAVNNVFKNNYNFIYNIDINFYENEINFIKSLKSKGERNIALSLLYMSKIYGNPFYCYHSTLKKLTGLSIRHIKRVIKKLENNNFFDVLNRNQIKKVIVDNNKRPLKYYSFPNTYEIKILGKGKIVFSCSDVEKIEDINSILK